MLRLLKVWTVVLLCLNCAQAADRKTAPRALGSVRQELWDGGLWDDNVRGLGQEEEEILLQGQSSGPANHTSEIPEELSRALAKYDSRS